MLDSPPMAHCFEMEVQTNHNLVKEPGPLLQLEFLEESKNIKEIKVGEPLSVRFKLTDPKTGLPRVGLKDVRVLTFLVPGTWQKWDLATQVGEGIYEVEINVPRVGSYFVFFSSS